MSGIFERTYPGYDVDTVIFDLDDPDFKENYSNKACSNIAKNYGIHIRHSKSDSILLSTSDSFYQLENLDNNSIHRNSVFGWPSNRLHSLDCPEELYNNSFEEQNSINNTADTTMLTIEGLRSHYNSCFTCGVSWVEDHVSLDCSECGGYAMQRPCPRCDGQCEGVWTRDLAASHKSQKAKWEGDCKIFNNENKILQGLLKNKLSAETCDNLLAKALDQLKTPL